MSKTRRTLLKIAGVLLVLVAIAAFLWFSRSSPFRYGHYVPADLEDAHAYLLKHLSAEELQRIREMKSEDEIIYYHMGLGMGMRNGWSLWGGGRLADYFRKLGIRHPDDMSGIILDTFWCKLHHQPFHLQEKIASAQAFYQQQFIPDDLKTPDGAKIEFNITYQTGTPEQPRMIHVGKSPDGNEWVYEYGKGPQKMTPAMRSFLDANTPPGAALPPFVPPKLN